MEKPIKVFKTFLDIVLPPVCYMCGKSCSSKYGLCDFCLEKIHPIPPPHCQKCGRRVTTSESLCAECIAKKSCVERGWSCCHYKDTIKECIHLFKYRGYVGLVDIFKDVMAGFIKKHRIHEEVNFIVPVPIYATKKRERTYNHAEVLARSLSKFFVIPMDTKNLKKIKWTQSQSELGKEKRLKNVKDTFLAVDRNVFSGKSILLVDDVYTTGATIDECAKILLLAGAGKVFSLVLARGA